MRKFMWSVLSVVGTKNLVLTEKKERKENPVTLVEAPESKF
jgi:hypothetical protein